MPTTVAIRKCRPDECASVLDIWKEAGSMTSVTDTVETLARMLEMPATAVLVAEHDGRLVGTIVAAFDGWRGNLYRLAILPAYRRRGVATLLVNEAERFLSSQGVQRIGGLVAKDEPGAVSFWDAMGSKGYVRDDTLVRYVRTL
jgi:ribosomal protein S18 acetylase RimI-like enzyme